MPDFRFVKNGAKNLDVYSCYKTFSLEMSPNGRTLILLDGGSANFIEPMTMQLVVKFSLDIPMRAAFCKMTDNHVIMKVNDNNGWTIWSYKETKLTTQYISPTKVSNTQNL
jgi:hypothetical protein